MEENMEIIENEIIEQEPMMAIINCSSGDTYKVTVHEYENPIHSDPAEIEESEEISEIEESD
jgi:hypothetical protein